MTTFTASEVRRLSNRIPHSNDEIADAQEALRAFADMLEADERAVPYCYTCEQKNGLSQGAMCRTITECEMSPLYDPEQDHIIPLFTHPDPADADRLAEALHQIALTTEGYPNAYEGVIARNALAAHSAQAQPPIQCNHAGRIICGTVHEGRSEVAWCNDCGEITHGSDATPTPNLPRHEDWCKKNVVAFGCLREGEGESACKTWCGHGNHCAVTLRDDCRKSSTAQAQSPAASVTDAMVERACKKYAFREDGAAFPDAYSDEEVLAERTLMREFLEHVLLAAQEKPNG